ncbi:MAG TPA: RiPP maturation radical SAM C-methyltransferase [Jatrophihabitans sp.]|jgi:ribosomal peptide maturation radical SAM protein 1|uniref:RiPP maturation radical SAM C-methyltransferase n=1 Tax=Jatrophihabitans sp. TaxID=1932789 RepID=UPI002F04D1C4
MGQSSSGQHTDVVLVSAPFGPLLLPSLGLSLLKSAVLADNSEVGVEILYLTIDFAKRIGPELYTRITDGDSTCNLLGEWLFADAVFPDHAIPRDYITNILGLGETWTEEAADGSRALKEGLIRDLLSARDMVPGFLEESAARIVSLSPDLVGFTTVFDQNLGSLALARAVKELLPDTPIIFGGPNCEGVMGQQILTNFPWVDAAVSGEGEVVFPEIVRRIRSAKPLSNLSDLSGVRLRKPLSLLATNAQLTVASGVKTMDELPELDYNDYFEQYSRADFQWDSKPSLLFETSRGCWWGQKHHCTFCGLNGATMRFRSKSSNRALRELESLTKRHPGLSVTVVDNILDYAYFKDMIPALARNSEKVDLFYEVKANLRRSQVEALRDAGIRTLQPGIESLDDNILDLMRKGVRALQNIQLLKWCKEVGITVFWNILYGLPDESPEDYARMAEKMRKLSHLPPPTSVRPVLLNRFSPLFEEAQQFGLANIRPVPAYDYIYALDREAVANLAYFFDCDFLDGRDVTSYAADVIELGKAWSISYESGSDLFYSVADRKVVIWDLRSEAVSPLTILDDSLTIDVFLACDAYRSASAVHEAVAPLHEGITLSVIEDTLALLTDRRLAISDENAYLSLPVRLGQYSPTEKTMKRLHEVLLSLSEERADRFVLRPEVVAQATLRIEPKPAMSNTIEREPVDA